MVFSNSANFLDSDVGKLIWIDGVLPAWTTIKSIRTNVVAEVSNAAVGAGTLVSAKIVRTREALIEDCVHTAESQVHFPDYYGIIAMRNDSIDADSTGRQTLNLNGVNKTYGLVLLADWWLNVTHISHEMLHGYGLQHSRNDLPSTKSMCFKPGQPQSFTDYGDPFDIMSAMCVTSFPGTFGMATARDTNSGPGMNAAMLDLMGWIPESRRWVWNGVQASTWLAPVNHPEWPGPLVAVVPLPDQPSHYYTIELRRADRWDRAFADTSSGYSPAWINPASTIPGRVLVHEVKMGEDGEPHSYLRSGLLDSCATRFDLQRNSFFTDAANDLTIEVSTIVADAGSAAITVRHRSPSDASVCAASMPYTHEGEYGGNASVDKCTTCGPGGKTPPKRIQFQ